MFTRNPAWTVFASNCGFGGNKTTGCKRLNYRQAYWPIMKLEVRKLSTLTTYILQLIGRISVAFGHRACSEFNLCKNNLITWESHRHLWANCLEIVGASTPHILMCLHGLLLRLETISLRRPFLYSWESAEKRQWGRITDDKPNAIKYVLVVTFLIDCGFFPWPALCDTPTITKVFYVMFFRTASSLPSHVSVQETCRPTYTWISMSVFISSYGSSKCWQEHIFCTAFALVPKIIATRWHTGRNK
jgi:hypothetical protein